MSSRIAIILSFTFACSHATRGLVGDDDARPDAASSDGAQDPKCSPRTTAFVGEYLPGFDAGTWYDATVLHVGDGGEPHVLVSERSESTISAGVLDWTRIGATWDRSGLGVSAIELQPGDIAVTPDGALCAAYSAQDQTLHLACDANDRTIAPRIDGSLAIVRTPTVTGLVFDGTDHAASGLLWKPFPNGFAGELAPSEVIDGDHWPLGTSAVAVDSAGDVHVAYVFDDSMARHIIHAVRHAGAWTRESIDDFLPDTLGIIVSNTVALALDGDQPVIAYGRDKAHGLRIARRLPAGTYDMRTLVATDPGFPQDLVGFSVALAHDCDGSLLIAYQRSISTDAPSLGVAVARIGASGLEDEQLLAPPPNEHTYLHSLGFHVDADGREHVSAMLSGPVLYYATR